MKTKRNPKIEQYRNLKIFLKYLAKVISQNILQTEKKSLYK